MNLTEESKPLVIYNTFPIARLAISYSEGEGKTSKVGGRFYSSKQEIQAPFAALLVKAAPGKTSYELKVHSHGHPVIFAPKLEIVDQFLKKSKIYELLLFFIFGGYCALFIYQILYGIVVRRSEIFYYSMLVIFFAIFLAITSGFIYILPDSVASYLGDRWAHISLLGIIFSYLFFRYFLNITKESFPSIDRILKLFTFSTILVPFYFLLPSKVLFAHNFIGSNLSFLFFYCASIQYRTNPTMS